jgi:hypothetical protein
MHLATHINTYAYIHIAFCLASIHTYIHAYIHTYIHTYTLHSPSFRACTLPGLKQGDALTLILEFLISFSNHGFELIHLWDARVYVYMYAYINLSSLFFKHCLVIYCNRDMCLECGAPDCCTNCTHSGVHNFSSTNCLTCW